MRREYEIGYVVPHWSSPTLEECLVRLGPDADVVVIETKPENMPLSKAWNIGTAHWLDRGKDAVVIINDDAFLFPTTGQDLAYALLDAQYEENAHPNLGADPGGRLLLVTGYNLDAGCEDIGLRWGIGAADYSCFCIDGEYIREVGWFDEGFQCYFEDNDSHRRIRLAGFEAASWAPYHHVGSATVNADRERSAQVRMPNGIFEQSRRRFIQKWNGMPDAPDLWEKPFNGGSWVK